MKSVQNNLIVLFVTVVLYILHFVIMPLIFSNEYPTGSMVGIVLLATLLVWCVISHYCLKCGVLMWILAEVIYALAVLAYNGRGFYGIGVVEIASNGKDTVYNTRFALVMVGLLVVFMFLIKLALVIIDFMYKKISVFVKARRSVKEKNE